MNNSQEKLISVRNLNFKYNKETILSDINFDIIKGENVAILGRNGGGKSTLIKVILGFLKKNSGSIEFFINKNKIGYLPQIREFDASFPINIFDLVISGLASRKNLFRRFNKQEKEQTEIISSPDIIFLDEPESFLDQKFEFQLFEKIKHLSDSTLVIISHEIEKIYNYIDTIFIVENNIKIFRNKEEYYSKHTHRH